MRTWIELCERSLARLGTHVTGDNGLGRYRSGPVLVDLFNQFGADDEYGDGFPSRWYYAEQALREINGTPGLVALMEHVFDPLEYEGTEHDPATALADINKFLRRDNVEIVVVDGSARIRPLSGAVVEFGLAGTSPASDEFVREHVEKCTRKLREGDYRGAITNARSLCEEVLYHVEHELDPEAGPYDGELPKLFKRVRKALQMDPNAYKERDAVLQLLRGMVSVIDGMSGMSNVMSDRHGGGRVQPAQHHAALAVNAANTICQFVVASYLHQREPTSKAS